MNESISFMLFQSITVLLVILLWVAAHGMPLRKRWPKGLAGGLVLFWFSILVLSLCDVISDRALFILACPVLLMCATGFAQTALWKPRRRQSPPDTP